MLLRIALLLAIVVLRPVAAWADPASDAAGEIMKQWGAPGALLVVAGLALLGMGYALQKSWQARLDDQRSFSDKFVALSNDYNTATHDIAKTTAAQSVAIEGIDSGAKARWIEAKGALDRIGDKLDDKLDPLAAGVAGNGTALTGIAADIRDWKNHALNQRSGGGR